MGKVIELNYKGNTYILEFNRRTLAEMSVDKAIKNQDYESLIKYVYYAMLKHQPNIKYEEVVEITDELDDLQGFVNALSEITNSAVESLKEKKGNATWGVKN